MKRILSVLLIAAMLLSLAACGDTTSASSVDGTSSDTVSENVSDTSSEETSSVDETVPSNVALGKKVFFSTQNNSLGMPASNATDGDEGTSWSSNTTTETINEWITVDLGKNYDITEITLKWGMSRATDYTIEISRGGIEFEEMHSAQGVTSTDPETVTTEKTARYIKINCTKVPSVMMGYMGATIKEIEVIGTVSDDQTLGSEKEAMITTTTIVPTENDVYVMGRNYTFNELIWAGATYEYKCTGSVAGAVLNAKSGSENIRFEVSVDGGEFVMYSFAGGASTEYIFAEDLDPAKEHTVCIMKAGDVWEPSLTVEGVLVEEGADIVKNYTRDYDIKIEFIGDSITSGGVTNDYAKSYVYLTAKEFNANFNVVSRSGQGLYKHANFGTPGPLKSLYAGIGSETGDYDYSFDADLVVLNIGTNDGANVRNTEKEEDKQAYRDTFTKMYVEMLEKIHEANPDAIILCTGGLMGDIGQVKPEIATAVDTFKKANPDVEVHLEYLSAAKDVGKETSWHPGIEGHAKGAEELIAIIKKIIK